MLANRHIPAWHAIIFACSVVTALVVPNSAKLDRRDEGFFKSTRAIAGGIPLRIMPLGASITHGVGSSDGNGYRNALRTKLVSQGNLVNMVGSNPNGTMKDNENEGWPGFIISQIHTKSTTNVPINMPNLVLVNAGTNDAIQNIDIANAGSRMSSMINDVFLQSPQATVVLSTLTVNANADSQARTLQINEQYKQVVTDLQNVGFPIVLADMQSSNGPVLGDINPDGIHPNDTGYVKMSAIWLQAIAEADSRGFIRAAAPVDGIPDDGGL